MRSLSAEKGAASFITSFAFVACCCRKVVESLHIRLSLKSAAYSLRLQPSYSRTPDGDQRNSQSPRIPHAIREDFRCTRMRAVIRPRHGVPASTPALTNALSELAADANSIARVLVTNKVGGNFTTSSGELMGYTNGSLGSASL